MEHCADKESATQEEEENSKMEHILEIAEWGSEVS